MPIGIGGSVPSGGNTPGGSGDQLLTILEIIEDNPQIGDAILDINNQESGCYNEFDITHLIPKWIRARVDDGSNFVDFIVNYYNWLYCKNERGSGYYTDLEEFQALYALQDTPLDFLKKLSYAYAHGFPEDKIESRSGSVDDLQRFRNFISDIRTDFYHRKGSEDSYKYFFKTLYGVTGFGASGSDAGIEYPKKRVFRLNGGRFAGWKAMENGSTGSYEELSSLGGSYLNHSILRDGWWYQDYSYLLKTGKDDETYSDILLSVLHPAGLKVFFEKTLEDYVPIGGSTTDYDPYASLPILENYFPYKMTSTEDVNVCVGCSGTINTSSYYGVGYTYDAPAHKHPVWSIRVPSGITPEFGEFNIWNFVELSPPSGITINPNDGISACADISGCLSIPIPSP